MNPQRAAVVRPPVLVEVEHERQHARVVVAKAVAVARVAAPGG